MNDNQPDVQLPKQTEVRQYVCKVIQTGTSDPVAYEMFNTYKQVITWTRTDVGTYNINFETPFTDEEQVYTTVITRKAFESTNYIQIAPSTAIQVLTLSSSTNNPADGLLNATIEVKTYLKQ